MKTLEEIINGMFNRFRAEIWKDIKKEWIFNFKEFRRMGMSDTEIIDRFIKNFGDDTK